MLFSRTQFLMWAVGFPVAARAFSIVQSSSHRFCVVTTRGMKMLVPLNHEVCVR